MAASWQRAEARGRAFETAVREVGLGISPPDGIHIAADPIHRKNTLVCLGVALDDRGSADAMLAHRKEAEGAWLKWRTHVVAKQIPLGEQVRALQSSDVPSLVWGAQPWAPNSRFFDPAEAAEIRWLQRMAHASRPVPEDWVSYHRRRGARGCPCAAGSAWEWRCTCAHGWSGHTLRHPESPACAAVHWRGRRWWQTVRALQAAGAGHEPHPCTKWQRRTEYATEQWMGDSVHNMALDKTRWAKNRKGYVAWCSATFCPRAAEIGRKGRKNRSRRIWGNSSSRLVAWDLSCLSSASIFWAFSHIVMNASSWRRVSA